MDSRGDKSEHGAFEFDGGQTLPRACPACGAMTQRRAARYCATCGGMLAGGYLPADALRASYHRQHTKAAHNPSVSGATGMTQPINFKIFPTPNRNGVSTLALAFATYALVPYLGIIFCPGALVMGGIGFVYSWRAPQRGGRRASSAAIALGLVILCLQLLLWWIIIKLPQAMQ